MNILVTGGAGYIGAHVAKVFLNKGAQVSIIDDLTNSNTRRVDSLKVDFIEGSILDEKKTSWALQNKDLVIHCAAYKSVEESENDPDKYHEVNYVGTQALLNEMHKAGVSKLIFASSAAVYGNSAKSPIKESDHCSPVSVYGQTKLKAEELISEHVSKYGLKATSLRFFNAVGSATVELADTSKDNLFPRVFAALEKNNAPAIYGDDYPTKDGTCIRDYIHVLDIATAHFAAYEKLSHQGAHKIYNVGTGVGYSVKEVIQEIELISQKFIEPRVLPRRLGDLDVAFADTALVNSELNWKAEYALKDMVQSAWHAWRETS